jgi:hypothetical protein
MLIIAIQPNQNRLHIYSLLKDEEGIGEMTLEILNIARCSRIVDIGDIETPVEQFRERLHVAVNALRPIYPARSDQSWLNLSDGLVPSYRYIQGLAKQTFRRVSNFHTREETGVSRQI